MKMISFTIFAISFVARKENVAANSEMLLKFKKVTLTITFVFH